VSDILDFAVNSVVEFDEMNEAMTHALGLYAEKLASDTARDQDHHAVEIALKTTELHALQAIAAALTTIAQKES